MLIDVLHELIRRKLRRFGVQSRFYEHNSYRLHYYEYRHPNPRGTLVLLHGLGTSSSTWVKIFPFLIQHHRVLAIDLPGFGFSTINDGRSFFKLAEHRHAVEDLLDSLLLEPFGLMGQSFGGWLAAQYASRHPRQVKHLILINTAGVYYRGIEEARRVFTVNSTDDLRGLLDAMWYHYPWYFKPFTRAILHDMTKRRVNEIVAAVEPHDLLTEEFNRLKMPVSIIWGKEDRLFSQESVHAMRKMILHVHVHFLAQCGHVPQLEKPQALIKVLEQELVVKLHR